MFAEKTLFILGAGAGNDLGLPTGEELSTEIARKLTFTADDFGRITGGDAQIAELCRREARRLNENVNLYFGACRRIADGIEYSRSIDEYINKHKEDTRVQFCAKLAIAKSIFEKEKSSHLFVDKQAGSRVFLRPSELSKSWMLPFVRILHEGIGRADIETITSRISIVNFNYDRSFEHYLYYTLQRSFGVDGSTAAKALSSLKILRPYGVLGALPWQLGHGEEYGGEVHGSPNIQESAASIKTFYEQLQSEEEVAAIRSLVASAKTIIFLGFGFHAQNMGLLKPGIKTTAKAIYATAYGESASGEESIKSAIRSNFGNDDIFNIDAVYVHRNMKCRALLDEYARVFSEVA